MTELRREDRSGGRKAREGRLPRRRNAPAPGAAAVQTPFLIASEAARYLRLSTRALENFRIIGGGPVFRRHGARIIYHVGDLGAWAQRRGYADAGAIQGRLRDEATGDP